MGTDPGKERNGMAKEMGEGARIIVGICREDNPADVDEAYGAGTYDELFPPTTCSDCNGRGRTMEGRPCELCEGTGKLDL